MYYSVMHFCHFCVAQNIKYLKLIFGTFVGYIIGNMQISFQNFLKLKKWFLIFFLDKRDHWCLCAPNLYPFSNTIVAAREACMCHFRATHVQPNRSTDHLQTCSCTKTPCVFYICEHKVVSAFRLCSCTIENFDTNVAHSKYAN
jgi:hypothetical protein